MAERWTGVAALRPACCLLLCLLLGLLLSLLLGPQPVLASAAVGHLGHQAWTTEDGLPQNSVHQVLQTRDGYLWIATEGGLARFDGLSFTIFRHEDQPAFPSDDIACLGEGDDGTLWIGTTDGLVSEAGGHFTRVSLDSGRPSPAILALAPVGQGTVLALTGEGILRVAHGRATQAPDLPAEATALAVDRDNSIWFTAGPHLLQMVQGRMLDRGMLPGPASPNGLEAERDGSLLLRTTAGLWRQSPGSSGSWTPVVASPLPTINAMLQDRTGRLWIGTRQGLFLVRGSLPPERVDEIGSRAVLSITEDREGDLWIGTEADGLHILRSQRVNQIPGLTDHAISALAETAPGTFWIGTRDDGLRVFHQSQPERSATIPKLSEPLTSQVVLALAAGRSGDLWVGTLDGLNHITGSHLERFSSADGLPDDVIRSLLVDSDGSLWIGTRRGLVHWNGQRGSPFTRINGLPSDLIGAMLRAGVSLPNTPARGPLWVATLDGLSRIDGTPDHPITRSYKLNGAPGAGVVTSLAEDSMGTLWVGTRGRGLGTVSAVGLQPVNGPGLPRDINSVVAGRAESLWLSTPRGLFRVAADVLRQCQSQPPCEPTIAHLGYADGMPTDETTAIGHPAALRAADGTLYFATTRGVASLEPSSLREKGEPPPVTLERFLVDNRDLLPHSGPLHLPSGHGSFTFDYTGLSFIAPARVRYRYRLEGFDPQWTEAGTRRTAYYTNLPPGSFTFLVQAQNSDGVWNRTGARLAFTILPPFYRRWWFYGLVLLLAASLAYAIYYLRVRRLRSEFDAVLGERSRIAREIHDTLAQNFVGISLQLQIAEQLLRNNDTAGTGEQLQQTRALVQEGLHDARQSIWELRASVAQDSLPTRISRAAERASGTGLHQQVTIGGIYRALDPAFEKEVLRIAQEALANVTRHAHATQVSVELRYEAEQLRLAIVDNGMGFDPQSIPSAEGHFGLQGMRERAAALAGTLTVASAHGGGTSVALTVPLPRSERRSS